MSSCLDRSDRRDPSVDEEDVLCMEQRLVWELEGLRFEADDDVVVKRSPEAYLLR